MKAKNKPNEIYISRIYDAPVKLVWDAWTDTKKVAKWWGPRGFTITTHSKDLRVGGHWAYTMHGPDGTDWENKTIYHEVEQYKRLVYDHGGNDDRPPLFRVTVEFQEMKGKTYMEMTMAVADAETAKNMKKFIKDAGGNATWDRLGEFLDKEISDKETFIINRTFETSVETMFQIWTDPKHFSKWLGPTGSVMSFIEANLHPGGVSFYKMTHGDFVMYGKIEYKEIERPNKLVYTQIFCDEKGNMSRHPGAPLWPERMLTVVHLTAESENQTRVMVHWEPYGHVTADELAAFAKEKPGITLGWTGSFDKLEELLTTR